MLSAARVPATCPIAFWPLWTALNPYPQLALYEPVQAIGNRLLASVAAVQIYQLGTWAAVAHTVYQLTQRSPGRRREGVASMAKVVEVDSRQVSLWSAKDAIPSGGSCHPARARLSGW
jgi:hypothetical protein